MLLSTPGLVLHTTPYSESSVVVKVFTRQLGVRSYIIKGVRGPRSHVKQNLLQPLSCLDMVVYNNEKSDLNYVKELAPRHIETIKQPNNQAIAHSIRFFMTEVLYKALREAEPMPALFDYVESCSSSITPHSSLPIVFLLTVARHLGIEPLDNHSSHAPLFDLQEGCFVSSPTETSLSPALSSMLHEYLTPFNPQNSNYNLDERKALINALIAYYHLHLSGFSHFQSHEILHVVLK